MGAGVVVDEVVVGGEEGDDDVGGDGVTTEIPGGGRAVRDCGVGLGVVAGDGDGAEVGVTEPVQKT